ncbi:hypothetical protein PFDSM3638_04835 [Pyrococcus furiosus DSM 3638]|uniref:Uncharacterized protein n=3 Tax=Pyrococcus furiosus TaxID=2261 RepID=Q8U277_PYRFU|nr:hypothetical protein [Pyrococcus furiosus]AAL81086.1 hypothetical protein PF0962 [Pyrococcus furiosus DSM 3638]AFN03757.1 hypothetical protein PFC_04040 [Pyrococcus furiosus COM1]QEK78628.1 hypothetical protein PFDSM3638_04835 [Pyrococcus furiosus DSM 3638]
MLKNVFALVVCIIILSGTVSATKGIINPTYIDPGTGGGDVVYLGVDKKLTYSEYGDAGVEDHSGLFYIDQNGYYLGTSQKVSASIKSLGFGYVVTYAEIGEKFDTGGKGAVYATIEVPIKISGSISLSFGEASYRVDVCIKDLTTGSVTCFNADSQDFSLVGIKDINRQNIV